MDELHGGAKVAMYYVLCIGEGACTRVLFLRKAELGFFHFLEIVTGWLVPFC
jgi:hypothetical protein